MVVYEQFPEIKPLGDIISFGPNAGRIFYRWSGGKVADAMRPLAIDLSTYGFNIHKYDTGEIVINQPTPEYAIDAPNFNGHRGELHEVVYNYAKDDLKIPIHLGKKVLSYDEDDKQATITFDNGEKVSLLTIIHTYLDYLEN